MNRYSYNNNRAVQINDPEDSADNSSNEAQPSNDNDNKEDLKPFMGVKQRRLASFRREYKGDYLDVPSQPYVKILDKQGNWTSPFDYVFNAFVEFSCEIDVVCFGVEFDLTMLGATFQLLSAYSAWT